MNNLKLWKKELGIRMDFTKDILKLLRDNNLPVSHISIIEQAIVLNKVKKPKRITMLLIPRDELEELILLNEQRMEEGGYEYALLTPIEATNKEFKNAFTELKSTVKDQTETEDIEYQPIELKQKQSNTISSIKEHRKWYWMHQSKKKGGEGLSYLEISKKEEKENPNKYNHERETIRKGIKSLEKQLQKLDSET